MGYLYLRQKVFSIGESFTFFDFNQTPIFTARGSFFAIPKRYQLFDARMQGNPIIEIRRKVFSFMPRYTVTHQPNGQLFCTINQRFRIGGARFDIHTPHDGHYQIIGSIFAHEFRVENAHRQTIVSIRKHWLAWGDTYEIMFDERLITAETAAAIILTIDCAIHSKN
ncbi:MAG: LURP-one-related family protein [Firmicutes bacterium]|nr:LURP-one-related family protein [Bacillota bacterium]